MDPKPRPNYEEYLQVLRSLTPEQKLAKAFELSAIAKSLLVQRLRRRFPGVTGEEFWRVFLARQAFVALEEATFLP